MLGFITFQKNQFFKAKITILKFYKEKSLTLFFVRIE